MRVTAGWLFFRNLPFWLRNKGGDTNADIHTCGRCRRFDARASGSAAVAQSAAPLSLASQMQTVAGTNDASDLRGGFILPTLAILAIIGAIILLSDDNGPSSP